MFNGCGPRSGEGFAHDPGSGGLKMASGPHTACSLGLPPTGDFSDLRGHYGDQGQNSYCVGCYLCHWAWDGSGGLITPEVAIFFYCFGSNYRSYLVFSY